MNRATQAAELYPWLRARLWIPLPFTPSAGVTSPFSASGSAPFIAPIGRDVTPRRLECGVFVATTNSGSKYWTVTLSLLTTAGASTTQGAVNTSALTANAWNVLTLDTFVTSPWDSATYAVARVSIATTGAPGNLYLNPVLWVS